MGQVHLGVVHILQLPLPIAEKRESMILGIEFLTPDQLRAERDTLETWSQICTDNLEKLLVRECQCQCQCQLPVVSVSCQRASV